jgi:septal ring factor EnvC (AmiA/AmiB activator)
MNVWQLIATVVGGGGGLAGIGALFLIPGRLRKMRSESKLSDADAAAKLSESALKLLAPAQQQATYLTQELEKAGKRADDLAEQLRASQAEAESLRVQMSQMSKELIAAREEIVRRRA